MKTKKFDVQGMACSSCAAHVEKVVSKLQGVKNVNVNLLTNSMIVKYDEKVLSDEQIINAVVDAGFKASLVDDSNTKLNKEKGKTENDIKYMKKRLIVSICFLIPLMFISMYHMIFKLFDVFENALIFAVSQFLLLIPIVYMNRKYFIVGFKRLLKRSPNMDSLVAIGSGAAIVYGIFATCMIGYGLVNQQLELVSRYSKDIYFESAGTILTLITLGKYLETKSKGKTKDAISKLMNLAPNTAIVLRDGKEIELPTQDIVLNDVIVIKPGSNIPVDGIVFEGSSFVDQSSITGESLPVEKNVGDNVISGTINKNGALKIRATKVGSDTTIAQIIKLVEEASNSKAPISKLADKVSSIFVPIVILIAIVATIIWLLLGYSFEFALSIGIAVLVISCPCALGLATPVAIMVGTGKGAENGILIKSADSLELLHLVNTVVLDKTGTITEGKLKVTDIITDMDETEFLKIAGSLEKNSEHLLADAIIEKVDKIELYNVNEFISVPGRGVNCIIENQKYFGGNISFMKENKINIDEFETKANELLAQGKTCIYFGTQDKVIGIIGIADTIKDTSSKAIKELKKLGLEVIMLTGDNKIVAENIAKDLELDRIIADVLPVDKENEITKLQKEGKKVAFVGDGINDSPALAKSDVGIGVGFGTDIAIDSADVILMKNDLVDVVGAINLSKAVIKNIKMNLFWAFFYNIIGIPIAAGVLYSSIGLKLNPMIGALAMSLSSVCVVTNALRLRKIILNK